MKIKINQLKKLAIALLIFPLLSVVLMNSASVKTRAAADGGATDVATLYKDSKCSICHGPTAAKFFDSTLADDKLVEIVLKGKKAEKPPNMPAYEAKGLTEDQAKALVAYMKTLK